MITQEQAERVARVIYDAAADRLHELGVTPRKYESLTANEHSRFVGTASWVLSWLEDSRPRPHTPLGMARLIHGAYTDYCVCDLGMHIVECRRALEAEPTGQNRNYMAAGAKVLAYLREQEGKA